MSLIMRKMARWISILKNNNPTYTSISGSNRVWMNTQTHMYLICHSIRLVITVEIQWQTLVYWPERWREVGVPALWWWLRSRSRRGSGVTSPASLLHSTDCTVANHVVCTLDATVVNHVLLNQILTPQEAQAQDISKLLEARVMLELVLS